MLHLCHFAAGGPSALHTFWLFNFPSKCFVFFKVVPCFPGFYFSVCWIAHRLLTSPVPSRPSERPFPVCFVGGDILICLIALGVFRPRSPDVLRSSATPHHVLQVRRRGPLNPSPSSLQTRPDRSIINPSRHVLNQPANE